MNTFNLSGRFSEPRHSLADANLPVPLQHKS